MEICQTWIMDRLETVTPLPSCSPFLLLLLVSWPLLLSCIYVFSACLIWLTYALFHVIISHFCLNTTLCQFSYFLNDLNFISPHYHILNSTVKRLGSIRVSFAKKKKKLLLNKDSFILIKSDSKDFVTLLQKISISNAILLTVKLSIH